MSGSREGRSQRPLSSSRAPRRSPPSLPPTAYPLATSTARGSAPSLPDTPLHDNAQAYYDAPYSAFNSEDISCNCDPELLEEDEQTWFECTNCKKHQHVDCVNPDSYTFRTINVPFCNGCTMAELNRVFQSQRLQFDQLSAMLLEQREEARDLCAGVLWKHYCNLPKGQSSDVALEMTRTVYQDGAMVPIRSAPDSWVDEVQSRIVKMVGDAGEDMVQATVGPENCGTLILETGHLVFWRDLAQRLLYGGSYRGNKAEFGLMAEVLGLVERGTFWQEGWMEIQSDSATLAED